MMTKQERIDQIIAVLKYQGAEYCTCSFRVGSLARQRVCDILGIEMGIHSIEDSIKNAKVDILRDLQEFLKRYIKHMIENPVDKCLACNSLYHREAFNRNTFVVKFEDNYIETLLTYISPDKAIERLLEEGSVALKIELTKGVHKIADEMLEKIDTLVKDKEESSQTK